MAFETFLMALAEHSSWTRVYISEMYSIQSHHHDSTLWFLLVSYLVVVVLKTMACLVIYRLRWNNINERTLRHWLHQQNILSRKKKSSFQPENDETAIVLRSVCKNIKGSSCDLSDISMNIKYGQITVLQSVNELEGMTVLCKLCAGFYQPEKGHVQRFDRGNVPVHVSYIITVRVC